MTTQTSPITLSTSSYVTNAAGNTVITSGPAVVNPTYTAGVIQSFTNYGTLESTGAGNGAQSSGIDITLGDAAGQQSAIGNGGLITGYDYGIYLGAHNASSVPVGIFNIGTITGRATQADIDAGTLRSSGIFAGQNVVATISNDGVVEGGEGIWLQTNDAGTQSISNDVGASIIGTASENGIFYGVKIQDNNNGLQGTGIVNNAGYISGLVDIAAKYAYLTNQSTGTITGGIFALGSGILDLTAGGTVDGGADFQNGANNGLTLGLSTIILNGTTTTVGQLTDAAGYQGFGFITIAAGSTWLIGTSSSSAGFASVSTINDFGTIDLAGDLTGNTIDMEGSVAGAATEVDFTGSASSTPLVDYGANDQIVFATLAGGAGTTYQDSYNSATGVLTVTEIDASGNSIGSATASVTGIPGQPSLTSADFVDINGPNGETIVLGSSTLANQGSIYLDYGESATLNNTAGVDTVPVTFGSHQSALGVLNTLDIDGSVSGTDSPYQGAITGFGLNDDIILGPSTLPSLTLGGEVSLSYTGSLLSVTEFDSNGASIGSTTLDVGAGYDPNSFVALLGADGVNLETADTVDEQPLTFNASGTANFETTTDYSGGLAPGSSIVSGETIIIASGTAAVSMTAPITDSGTIIVSGASSGFVDTSPLSGDGVLDLQDGAAATIAAPSSLSDIDMGGNNAGTSLDLLGNFVGTGHTADGPTITNFGTTDQIVLNGFTSIAGDQLVTFFNTATGELSISEYNGTSDDESALVTIAAPGGAMLIPGQIQESFGPNGLIITDMPCFAAGTRILTPNGERRVESLAAGDEVLTARDGSAQTIIWTGSRTIDISRHANPEKVIPVLILAGAFGDGLPERDLRLSPDHALFIDGHLIEAKTLVNGATVIRDRAVKFVTYHHIELERHDVILAEGLPAETYLDSGNRQNFQTDAGPLALHPDFAAKARDAACATLLTDGEIVRAARQNLLNRAATLGFTTTDEIDLTAKASGERIKPQIDQTGRNLLFVLPEAASSVSLLSATGVPAEILADPSDRRILGVAITGLALITGGSRVEIDLQNPAHAGLHGAEAGGSWTNGHAVIALPAYEGGAMLEVTLAGQAARWQENRIIVYHSQNPELPAVGHMVEKKSRLQR